MNLFFNFNGRIGRGKYWLGILVIFALAMALFATFLTYFISIGGFEEMNKINQEFMQTGQFNLQEVENKMEALATKLLPLVLIINIVVFLLLYMTLAIDAKRLHDMGYTGWLSFLGLLPIVNIVMLIWLGVARGQQGPNEYGPDPRAV